MYGTIARTRVKPENRDTLEEVFARQNAVPIEGYEKGYVLFEDGSDVAWMFVVFTDEDSYRRNADDPAMHQRYTEYRPLMEDEPEWHDGEIRSA